MKKLEEIVADVIEASFASNKRRPSKTAGGASSGGRDRSGGRGGGYPVPMNLYKDVTDDGPTDKDIEIFGEAKKKKDEEDLGFGFNKDGYALQDKYDFQDMPISIENKKSSTRKWYDPDGKVKGSTKMHLDYGYIDSSKGYDGDEIDVYIGPDEDAEYVFVIHQNKAPEFTEYDEDKVMIGFASEEKAKKAYLKQYDDVGFFGGMSSMPLEKFKEKLEAGSGKKITNEKKIIENLFKLLFEAPASTDITFGKQQPAAPERPQGVKQAAARTVILKNLNKLKKRNIDVSWMPKMLGIGSRGAAFELPNNRVIKITDDNREAIAANKIKSLGKMKHVYQVFDVFQFKDTNLYGIVQEKLTPLQGVPKELNTKEAFQSFSGEAEILMRALTNLNFHSYVGGAKSWENVKWAITQRVKDIVEVMPKSSEKSVENFVGKMNSSWKHIVNFGIKDMFEELTAAGISFKDYHPGNIMRRADGTAVIVDIGYSHVQGGQEPDVLEKKIKEATKDTVKPTGSKQFGGRPDITAISNTQSFSEKDIVDVIKKYSRILQNKKGFVVNLKAKLGNGSYGVAYEVSVGGKRLVFKVTGDKTEAKASGLIKGKNTQYLCKIYDVFQFKGSQFYGILQELLEPLTDEEKDGYNEFIGVIDKVSNAETIRSGNWKQLLADAEKHLKHYYPNEWKRLFKLFYDEGTRFNFEGILSELQQHKIQYLDFHEGNIMKRGSTFVLIDLGASRSPGPDPDVLEKKIREATEDAGAKQGINQTDARTVVSKNLNKLKKRGVDVSQMPRMLGAGTRGVVFQLPGSKAVKITDDKQEAVAANRIKSLGKMKHVYHVYDVFQFKDTEFYGIVQEKLTPLKGVPKELKSVEDFNSFSGEAKTLKKVLDELEFTYYATGAKSWEEIKQAIDERTKLFTTYSSKENAEKILQKRSKYYDYIVKFGIKDLFEELTAAGISFKDYHPGNIMRRTDGTPVVIDVGYSHVQGGQDPDVLEKKIREAVMAKLFEGKANSVATTIGSFQPFHKAHGEILRKLAAKNSKVIVFISGNAKNDENPFSYEAREELLRASTPDIEDKLEVYKAESSGGAQTEYFPELIDRIIREKNSTIEPDVAVNIAVGRDRADSVKKQIEQASAAKEKDGNAFVGFDPSLYVVQALPELDNGGNGSKVSEKAAREALKKNNKEAVKALLDPHVLSDETLFNNVYEKLRTELGVTNEIVNEDLKSAGGPSALQDALAKSANLVKLRMGIDVQKMKFMDNGTQGVAFDVGNGKVLKLTTDEKEAKASHSLEGKTLSRIARIFKVFKLKDKVGGGQTVFIIEQEKVSKISSDEAREFDAAMKTIGDAEKEEDADGPLTSIAHGDLDRMYKFMRVFWAKEIRGEMNYAIGSQPDPRKETKLSSIIAKREQILKRTVDKFNLVDMMDELKKNNIKFADYHSGNIGKKGSDYVVFDLGKSEAEGASNPPLLEAGIPASPTNFSATGARVQSSPWSSGNVMEPDPQGDEDSRTDARTSHDKLTTYAMAPKYEDTIIDAVVQLLGPTNSIKK